MFVPLHIIHYYSPQVPAVQLTVDALGAVQSLLELAESSDYDSFVPNVYRHLIFNFYIWRRADYNVQSGTFADIMNVDSFYLVVNSSLVSTM